MVNAYLASVRRRIQETLVVPAAAQRLGLAGQVRLRFAIASDGKIVLDTLRVVGGTDSSVLQDGAMDTIRAIAAFSPPPHGAMTIEVPAVFSLRRQ